jgi:hypothetical protein
MRVGIPEWVMRATFPLKEPEFVHTLKWYVRVAMADIIEARKHGRDTVSLFVEEDKRFAVLRRLVSLGYDARVVTSIPGVKPTIQIRNLDSDRL